ncbi:MAG: hypothetical protein AAGH17_07840 [Pseudomonadota bacterium]
MKNKVIAALAAGLIVASATTAPSVARADAVTAGVVAKLLLFGTAAANRGQATPRTSVNTHYALTGQGKPVRSLRQPPIPNVVIRRHAPAQTCHGHHGCGHYKKW